MIKVCKYCNEEIEFDKPQQYAGHISGCDFNPNKKIKFENLKLKLKDKDYSHLVKSKEYVVKCQKCNKEYIVKVTLEAFEKGNYKKYCSRSCANSRIWTEEDKLKKSTSVKMTNKENPNSRLYKKVIKHGKYETKERQCPICSKTFISCHKTCSEECKRKYLSKMMSERLSKSENRTNYGRYKRSYLELSFEEWLKKNNINDFECEKKFLNLKTKKNYFADFTFEKKKLIIELDGTQHLKTVEGDKKRDEYIEKEYGFKVVRISYKEYKNKTREVEILKLLQG